MHQNAVLSGNGLSMFLEEMGNSFDDMQCPKFEF